MKIIAIDCHHVTLPLLRPHRWTGLTATLGSYVLVNVQTDDGLSGWGEATVHPQWGGDLGRYYGESPTTAIHLVNDLLWPVLSGADPHRNQLVYDEMERAVRGHPYVKSAVDAAILDLVAQSAGLPVYMFLGGQRRTAIPITHVIGLMPVAEVVEEARAVAAEGVSPIKLKVGEDHDRDLEVVRKVHQAVGDQVEIAVDANQGWAPVPVAQRMISRLSSIDLRYVEQPVPGISAMAQLASRVRVPLMADESVWTAHDMAEVARHGEPIMASIYTTKAGGLLRAMQVDAVAHANGLVTTVNAYEQTGIGALGTLHLACAMASLGEACMIPVSGSQGNRPTKVAGVTYSDDVLAEPFAFHDGCVLVPDSPGWGIPVDIEKVERYTVEKTSVSE
jgi:muconate cycloisomerase